MSKFYYYYGVVNSSKTMQLLATAHNYESQGKRIALIKPSLDTRSEFVESRVGIKREADVIVDESMSLDDLVYKTISKNPDAVLIDECQFLSYSQIHELTKIPDVFGVPLIAYGLLTDFKGDIFEGSRACITFSDKMSEIKTVCQYCNSKALFNLRLINNYPQFSGSQVEIGDVKETDEIYYKPVCRKCYKEAKAGRIKICKG